MSRVLCFMTNKKFAPPKPQTGRPVLDLLITPKAVLIWIADYMPRKFACLQSVTQVVHFHQQTTSELLMTILTHFGE